MIAPGSRSTPMALALMRHEAMSVQVFHDERSAAFAGLGVGLATGEPAVILCSSGTAAAHFHAAVIEAHHSNVALLVCTADRPPHLRDVSAPQTIDQTHLYGDAVRWFHDPGVPDARVSHTWRSLASRAYQAAIGQRPGPVHLNLPFDEPLYGEPLDVPEARDAAWSSLAEARHFDEDTLTAMVELLSGRRGVFVAGKGSPVNLANLAETMGWPVLCDSRAGSTRGSRLAIDCFDPILRSASFVERHRPEIIVFVGEHPASKVLGQWAVASGAELVQWSHHGGIVDPFHRVGAQFIGDLRHLSDALLPRMEPVATDWASGWMDAARVARSAIDGWVAENWSEITVAHTVAATLNEQSHPDDRSHLVVSSSMPIRDLEWFAPLGDQVVVHANRGANGIDGVVSTAIGVALSTGARTTLLIGDVAFLHDASSLVGLVRRGVDLRIVVTNNDGGSIFSFLPQAHHVGSETFETIYGTPHGVDLASLCLAHGLSHRVVTSRQDLGEALFGSGPMVVEARFDRGVNVAMHDSINSAVVRAVDSLV